jgi:LPS-assembly protein
VDGRWGRRNLASVSYIIDRSNPLAGPLNRNYEFVQLSGQQFVYGNWGIAASGIADLERDIITRSEVGLLFDDDCSASRSASDATTPAYGPPDPRRASICA